MGDFMEKITPFNSLKDFIIFLAKKGCMQCQLIGEGAEGKCYLSNVDGYVYKVITNKNFDGQSIVNYDIKKVITIDDIELKQYILPEELYVVDNELVGYKTRYIKEKNIFDESNSYEILKKLYELKEKVLIDAYYRILKETEMLSRKQIKICDLTYNLLFTGDQYYGIDTCGYEKVQDNLLEYNKEYLDEAIKENFYTMLYRIHIYPKESIYELDSKEDMEEFHKGIIRLVKKRK